MPRRDHRFENRPFTCGNSRFRTHIEKEGSHTHLPYNNVRGSVFPAALTSNDDGDSLWLEHVLTIGGPEKFWLMWYDEDGYPKIPASGVMNEDDVRKMMEQLAGFIRF